MVANAPGAALLRTPRDISKSTIIYKCAPGKTSAAEAARLLPLFSGDAFSKKTKKGLSDAPTQILGSHTYGPAATGGGQDRGALKGESVQENQPGSQTSGTQHGHVGGGEENAGPKGEQDPANGCEDKEIFWGCALEGWEKRVGYFYTHSHVTGGVLTGWTGNPVQPSELTREGFFDHLQKCYAEASPEKAKLLYGCVVRELHKNSGVPDERAPHLHAATTANKKHSWLAIEKHSRERYGIKIHVSTAHGGYASQYSYIRSATKKKPLSELDQEPWLSKDHPAGAQLAKMLQDGERVAKGQMAKMAKQEKRIAEATLPGANKPRQRALQPNEAAQIVMEYKIVAPGHAWEVGRVLAQEQGDSRFQDWLFKQANLSDALRKLHALLSATKVSMPTPAQVKTTSKYPISDYVVPGGVTKWATAEKDKKCLILGGKSNAGKTQMLCALCVHMKWPYIFVDSIDALRGAMIPPNVAIIVDEFSCDQEHPDWVKKVLDTECDRSIRIRHENVFLPAGTIRMFSTQSLSEKEFFPPPRRTHDFEGMSRRAVFIPVNATLKRGDTTGKRARGEGSSKDTRSEPNATPGKTLSAGDELATLTFRELMQWKKEGLLDETEFKRLKGAWMEKAKV